MTISIIKLTIADLDPVDDLMKRHSSTLGFLPKEALRNYLEKENTLGAKTDDGKLIGYLLHAAKPDYFRIAQLCVAEDFNGRGVARQLINELKKSATTQKAIKLRCRNDFPAHKMWPKLGFSAIDEQPGRSKDKLPLTLWRLTLAPDDQLGLFQVKTSDDSLDVVIDAQIFFDFDEADSDKSMPSKALLSDFLIDALRLLVADELLSEIAREKDSEQREKSRNKAHEFPRIDYDAQSAERYEGVLKTFLPSNSPSQDSDIRQLAQTSASEVKIFVTQDQVPARILWYESGDTAGHIAAISCLDAVEIDTAKVLFRKFKKIGILEWKDIFDMCGGDPSKEIMALRFSHTFPFRKPVSLDAIRKVFDEHGAKPVLQSPYKLPTEIFCKLFQLGYPDTL